MNNVPSREYVEQLRQEWIASNGPAERVARRAYQDARDARLSCPHVSRAVVGLFTDRCTDCGLALDAEVGE